MPMSKMGLRVKNIEVGNRIGEASKFRIYSGKTDSGEQVILKVAKTFEDGDQLQITVDGVTYLVHATDAVLMTEER